MEAAPHEVADVAALFEEYKARHNSFDNWLSLSLIGARGVRRLGYHPTKGTVGILISAGILATVTLLPAVVYTTITGSWAAAPAGQWITTAALYGLLTGGTLGIMTRTNAGMLELHRTIASEANLRQLIAWDTQWFTHRVTACGAIVFVVLAVVLYGAIQANYGPMHVHPGTLFIGAAVAFGLGESVTALLLVVAEYPLLARARYDLYLLNPAQTLSLRRSLQAYQQFAAQASLYLSGVILVAAVLFAPHMRLILPIAAVLLGLIYTAAIVFVLAPRLLISGIVRRVKRQELAPLQKKLNELWAHESELDSERYEALVRMQDVHDRLYNAPENLFNAWGILGKIVGPVVLPTLATVLATLLQSSLL